jgi:hypothetical protein
VFQERESWKNKTTMDWEKRRIKKKNNGRQHTTIIEGTYYN